MKRPILFTFLVLMSVVAWGQKTTALPTSCVAGNASVAYTDDWSAFHNPAALGHKERISVGILYENKYITKELANKVASVAVPTKYINLGASFSHFGYSEYNEMLASLSFARKFGRLSIGVDAVYYAVYLSPSERYRGAFTTQVGMQVQATDDWSLAFSAFNPVFSKVKGEYTQKPLPTVFSIGSQYKIRGIVNWLVQFDKEITSPLRWATGFEYAPVEEFIVKVGAYGYRDIRPTLGLGMRLKGLKFDVMADYNSVLGFSLTGALGYEF